MVNVAELHADLERHGVRLDVKMTTVGPRGALTPDLENRLEGLRRALATRMPESSTPTSVTVLPDRLAGLVEAAIGNHLGSQACLPSGMVADLGAYVLATAARYAVGHDPERHLRDLWVARTVWTESRKVDAMF
ncbi:hypothetical protein [Deinococcus alpinitundrae]|uniref:hypothetical protein n=1 Tax=Deinococcus alpinitundrae TaxID=468913 RepID=UPI001379AA86|nr:hypothetical protein [Deinococcus alpinitundrae]